MDIAKIAQEHPKLLTSILAKSTGAIGEVLVADKLSSLALLGVEPPDWNRTERAVDGGFH